MDFYVTPEYRGKKVSDALFGACVAWFKERKIRDVEVTVHELNERAIGFYNKVGFKNFVKKMKLEI